MQVRIGPTLPPVQRFLIGGLLAIIGKFEITLKQYSDHYVIEAMAVLPLLLVIAAERVALTCTRAVNPYHVAWAWWRL